MYKVKVISQFYDMEAKTFREFGRIFIVEDKKRLNKLKSYVQVLETIKQDFEIKPKGKIKNKTE